MLIEKTIWGIGANLFLRRVRTLCLVLIVGIGLFPFSAQAFDVLLGSGAPGSFSYFTGRVLCRMINLKVDDVNCRQVPAVDDVHNLTNLQGGSLDISLVDSRTLFDAINKTGSFEFMDISYENLRAIAPLYDVPVTLIIRNDAKIGSLADLKGKRVNAGTPGSLQYQAVNTVLKAKNWSRKDFSLVGDLPPIKSQDTKAFCYGTMQAMVYIGIHPDFSLRRLLKSCNAELLSMDDGDIKKLVSDDPALWETTLAADLYPSHPKEIATFGTRAMLVTSEAFDEETVSKIIEAIDNNHECLQDAHSALSLFHADKVRESISGIEFHAGATKYFDKH